jgi:hypothetical protein
MYVYISSQRAAQLGARALVPCGVVRGSAPIAFGSFFSWFLYVSSCLRLRLLPSAICHVQPCHARLGLFIKLFYLILLFSAFLYIFIISF